MNKPKDTYEAALLAALAALDALSDAAGHEAKAYEATVETDDYNSGAHTAAVWRFTGACDAWHVIHDMVQNYRTNRGAA